jgi:hypothetical protein
MKNDALLDALLETLHMHFLAARRAYQAYLDDGRTFRDASDLKRINLAARALLLGKGDLLPEEYQPCAAALVGHYDVWLGLWDAHAQRTRPGPDDVFEFANAATYPREAEQRLEQLYEKLREAGR